MIETMKPHDYVATCSGCGCSIGFDSKDIEFEEGEEFEVEIIKCPKCKKVNYIDY